MNDDRHIVLAIYSNGEGGDVCLRPNDLRNTMFLIISIFQSKLHYQFDSCKSACLLQRFPRSAVLHGKFVGGGGASCSHD